MRALIASQAFGSNRRRGPRWSALNASALDACSAWFMIALVGLNNAVSQASDAEPERSSLLAKERIAGGQVRQFALARLVLSLILGAAVCASAVNQPGAAESSELARLAEALAATEAKEGPTSPYLLPLIEEIARFRLRQGDLAEAAALRRRALDIAVARFGCDSASAAEAMVALALVAIDRRRYLDAEPLLTAAQITLEERVAPDHPAMAASLASLARVTLARGDAAEAEKAARRAVDIVSRKPHRRSTEPLRALGAALAAEGRFAEAAEVLREALAEARQHHGCDGAGTARNLAQLANAGLRSRRLGRPLALWQVLVRVPQIGADQGLAAVEIDLFGGNQDAAARHLAVDGERLQQSRIRRDAGATVDPQGLVDPWHEKDQPDPGTGEKV